MEIDAILRDINNLINTFDKNMEYEETYIKDECQRISRGLADIFSSFGYNSRFLDDELKEIIESNLYYGYKANTNNYVNSIDEINIRVRNLARIAVEESEIEENLRSNINGVSNDYYLANSEKPYDINIENIFGNILPTLNRKYGIVNSDLQYEIQSMLRKKQEEIIQNIGEVRRNNGQLFDSSLGIVQTICRENSKNAEIFGKIDKEVEKQSNENYAKYGTEFAQMLNKHFSMISYEILKQLNGTDQIEQQQIQDLAMKLLSEKFPEFNDNYRKFCDSLSSDLIPQLTNRTKQMIIDKKDVDLTRDKKAQKVVETFNLSSNALVDGLRKNSIEDFDKLSFRDIIAKHCGLSPSDPKCDIIMTAVDEKAINLEQESYRLREKIIFENIVGVQTSASKSLESQTSLCNAFIG